MDPLLAGLEGEVDSFAGNQGVGKGRVAVNGSGGVFSKEFSAGSLQLNKDHINVALSEGVTGGHSSRPFPISIILFPADTIGVTSIVFVFDAVIAGIGSGVIVRFFSGYGYSDVRNCNGADGKVLLGSTNHQGGKQTK